MPIGQMLWNRQHLSCLPVMVFQNLTAWHKQEQTNGKQELGGEATPCLSYVPCLLQTQLHGKTEKGTFPDMHTETCTRSQCPWPRSCTYGWTKDKANKSLAAVHVPPNIDLALSYIQELIKCSCSSDPPCVSANCGCKKAGMPCSVSCACKITDCYRAQTHGDDGDDDHGGDDENDDDN